MNIPSKRVLVLAGTVVAGLQSVSLAVSTLTTELVVDGLTSPVFVTSPPGDSTRLLVVEQVGRIRILLNGQLLPTPFLDIETIVLSGGERGLLGLAVHTDYAANGYIYVSYTDLDGDTVIARYTRSADPNVADPTSAAVIMTIDQPFPNHNGGCLLFGPDDHFLYIPTGDGGAGGDPFGNAQNLGTRLGKILRIDVDGAFPFAISPDNPFTASFDPSGAALDEIWAYGLRNPWRCSFDRQTGDLYVADVGQGDREEVNFRPGASAGGENYGWKIKEGSACFDADADCNTPGLTDPFLDYGNVGANCSVTGGYVYRGNAIPELHGTYFFADFCSARIWSCRVVNEKVTELTERTSELAPTDGRSIGFVASFGEDAAGELYICDHGGEVFKIVARPEPAGDCPSDPNIEICNDHADNDVDGMVDSEDEDCPGGVPCAFALCGICLVPGIVVTIIGLVGLQRLLRRPRRRPQSNEGAGARGAEL